VAYLSERSSTLFKVHDGAALNTGTVASAGIARIFETLLAKKSVNSEAVWRILISGSDRPNAAFN